MLASITYNMCRESLGDISETEFVDAFEAEVAAIPKYRETAVEVTFSDDEGGVVKYVTDEKFTEDFDAALRQEMQRLAENAFKSCCF